MVMSNDITAAGSLIRIISRSRQNAFPGIKGFNRRGLYRMRKFYETYKDDEFVTTLLSQIRRIIGEFESAELISFM